MEEIPSPAEEANPPIREEQALDAVYNEFPTVSGEPDNYPMGNYPRAAYYTKECTPRAWMTLSLGRDAIDICYNVSSGTETGYLARQGGIGGSFNRKATYSCAAYPH